MMRVAGVSEAIQREVQAGTTRGPFIVPPMDGMIINALSARNKPSGDVRLILDLSQPTGISVNDCIDPD